MALAARVFIVEGKARSGVAHPWRVRSEIEKRDVIYPKSAATAGTWCYASAVLIALMFADMPWLEAMFPKSR
jgi:hypothetical protein